MLLSTFKIQNTEEIKLKQSWPSIHEKGMAGWTNVTLCWTLESDRRGEKSSQSPTAPLGSPGQGNCVNG